MKSHAIKCPHCEKETVYSLENPWRPFCSEQCRTLDLGAWASDSYLIADKSEAVSLDADITVNEETDGILRH